LQMFVTWRGRIGVVVRGILPESDNLDGAL
jgi:hypothetical protein